MAMPLRFVKEIHARLLVRYGTAWTGKWAGVDQEAVEFDWAAQLDGMSPESIRKALDSLPPEFPPTAPAFRALGVIREEAAGPPALPAPSDPVVAKVALDSMRVVGMPTPGEWMAKLDRDVKAGAASPARKRHHQIATENGCFA